MDREEFNPAVCMQRYSQDSSLQNLIAKKNHIDSDILTLTSDLQNMLYDNYTKFINATSVVSSIKTDFEKMEEEINLLHSKMEHVKKTSTTILENLRPTEGKISRLMKAQDTMKRLVLLTNLVPTLRTYVNSGSYSSAAKHYLKAENTLKKYEHLPSFIGIMKDCSEIVSEIKNSLRNKINFEIYNEEEICETLNLLLRLGESSESVLNYFFSRGEKYLICVLDSIEKFWENVCKESHETDELISCIVDYINQCCRYIEKVSKVIKVVKEVFLPYKEIIAIRAQELMENLLSMNINNFSAKLCQHLKDNFDSIDDNILSQILDKFHRQCYNSGTIAPQFNLHRKGTDVILNVCSHRCEFHFLKLKNFLNTCLVNLKREILSGISTKDLLVSLEKMTEHKFDEILQSLICYIRPEFRCCRDVTFRKKFCKVFVREGTFVKFLRYINEDTWRCISSLNFKEPSMTLMCVVLSKYLLDIQQDVAPGIFIRVDDCFCSTNENLLLSSAEDISKEFKSTAYRIINLYVDYYCCSMSIMIRKSMENKDWMKAKEPTRPRAVVKLLSNDIQKAYAEIGKFWGLTGSPTRSKTHNHSHNMRFKILPFAAFGNISSFEERLLLNKLFNGSPKLLNKIELNGPSILNCLIMKTLKSFLEYIRLTTFSSFSLQQVQIDICYLQTCISRIFVVENDTDSIFAEILSSASNRTYKPRFLSNAVVSAACNNVM